MGASFMDRLRHHFVVMPGQAAVHGVLYQAVIDVRRVNRRVAGQIQLRPPSRKVIPAVGEQKLGEQVVEALPCLAGTAMPLPFALKCAAISDQLLHVGGRLQALLLKRLGIVGQNQGLCKVGNP